MYDPQLVDNGVSALNAFERGLTAMLASGDATVAAAGSVGSALTDVKTALQALPPAEAAAVSPQLLVDINAAHSQVDSASSAITSALSSVRSSTVDAVASAEVQYLPRIHTYDRYRVAALIALFASSMSLGVLCALALLVSCCVECQACFTGGAAQTAAHASRHHCLAHTRLPPAGRLAWRDQTPYLPAAHCIAPCLADGHSSDGRAQDRHRRLRQPGG